MKTQPLNYTCTNCNSHFNDRNKLQRHHEQNKDCYLKSFIKQIWGKYYCDGCSYSSERLYCVKRHLKSCKRLSDNDKDLVEKHLGKCNRKDGKLTKVFNKRKHMEEYTSHVFKNLLKEIDLDTEDDDSKKKKKSESEHPFAVYIFKTCVRSPVDGTFDLIETIYFNGKKSYGENVNKHLINKKRKKMFIYRGNDEKDVIKTVGDETDVIIDDIVDQCLNIMTKIKTILFKNCSNEKRYSDKYNNYVNTIKNTKNKKLKSKIYDMFYDNQKLTEHLYNDYKHLLQK